MDFETRAEYSIEFFPSLPVHRKRKKRQSDTSYILHIDVTDVNEPPVFTQDTYFFTIDEGPVGITFSRTALFKSP